jgi:hypothetical protein
MNLPRFTVRLEHIQRPGHKQQLNETSQNIPNPQREIPPVHAAPGTRVLRIEEIELLGESGRPHPQPREPEPRGAVLMQNPRDHHDHGDGLQKEQAVHVLARQDVRRVDAEPTVILDILVAVGGVEVDGPQEQEDAERETFGEQVGRGHAVAVDGGPGGEDGEGAAGAEDVLGVDAQFARGRALAEGIEDDAGGEGEHEGPSTENELLP